MIQAKQKKVIPSKAEGSNRVRALYRDLPGKPRSETRTLGA